MNNEEANFQVVFQLSNLKWLKVVLKLKVMLLLVLMMKLLTQQAKVVEGVADSLASQNHQELLVSLNQ